MYLHYSDRTGAGHPNEFRAILDRLWDDIEDSPIDDQELEDLVTRADALLPEDDDVWVELGEYAQNAAAAVAYSVRCRQSGSVQDAVWAARQVDEAIDSHVVNRQDLDLNSPQADQLILSNEIMQAELQRESDCLDALSRHGDDIRRAAVDCRVRATEAPLRLDI